MQSGTISAVVGDRGFGFLRVDGDNRDAFFHHRDLVGLEFNDRLRELRVKFDFVETERGPRAKNIQRADD